MGKWLGRALSLALVIVAFAWSAPAAQAEDVFLIVSVEDEFDTDLDESGEYEEGYDPGSGVILVRIGSLTNNAPDPRGTEFVPDDGAPQVPLGDNSLDDLVGNESTVFGSFTVEEYDEEQEETVPVPHMVTPATVNILDDIQAAVFAASAEIAGLVEEGGQSSTGQIANIVKGYMGETSVTLSQIAEALFGGTTPLRGTGPEDDFSCEAEGELFPHPKDEVEPIFVFGFSFNEDGDLAYDLCLPADVEVKECSVNLKKKGTVSVAIYDSNTLETDEIVSVEIGGVSADKIHFAKKKATAQFDVQDLVDAFALTSSTTQVLVVATLEDGTCFAGLAEIHVK